MSDAVDILECMFEHREMATSTAFASSVDARTHAGVNGEPDASEDASVTPTGFPLIDAGSPTRATVEKLQARIRQMQATTLDTRLISTHPAIAALLPGGGLKQGTTYAVDHSATLVMALLAGPSTAGSWCAVVGMPEFGAEAASRFGIDLERLVLVPHPGEHWLSVTAALADVLSVVVTRPPKRASDSNVSRLTARLRQRGSTLIVLGPWPQSEAMLSLSDSNWSGIGQGSGHLSARQVTVTVSSRAGGRPRSARLWMPDPDEKFCRVENGLAEISPTESVPLSDAVAVYRAAG